MAICKMCHKSIPDGRDFCEECENKKNAQADESYLDSLLSSVSGDNEIKMNNVKSTNSSDDTFSAEEKIADIDIDMPDMEADMPDMEADIPDMEADMPDMEADIPDMEADIPDMEADIPDMEADMPDMEADISDMEPDIADIEADMPDMEADISDMEPDIADTESQDNRDLTKMLEEIIDDDSIQTELPEGMDILNEIMSDGSVSDSDSVSDDTADANAADDIISESIMPEEAEPDSLMSDFDMPEEGEPDSLMSDIDMPEEAEPDSLMSDFDMPDEAEPDSSAAFEPSDDMDELINSLFDEADESSKINEPAEPEPALEPEDITNIFEEAQAINERKFTNEDGETISVDHDIDSLFEDITNTSVPETSELLGEDELEATMRSNINDSDDNADIDRILDDINSGDFEGGISDDTDEGAVLEVNPGSKKKKSKKAKPAKEKKEKESLFKRLFANVKEERTPEQEEEYRRKLKEEEERKKAKAEQKKINAQESKERSAEKKKLDKEEAAKKAKLKEEEKKRKKEAAKEKAKKKKEERLALEEYEVDEGRINRAGATILFVIFAILTVIIIVGTNIYSYNLSIQNAQEEFDIKHYNDAYYEVYGLEIRDEDIELYDRIMTVMYVNTQLNSYEYYMKSGNREKALDSLLKGLQRYDKYLQLATILDIKDDLNYVKGNILSELEEEFGFSEDDAYDMIVIDDSIDYSEYIYKLLGTYEEGIIE